MIITSRICVYPTNANIIYPPFPIIVCVQSLILNSTYAVSSKLMLWFMVSLLLIAWSCHQGPLQVSVKSWIIFRQGYKKFFLFFILSRKKVRWRRGRNYYSLFLVWTQFCPKGLLPCLIENSGMPIRWRRDCRPNEHCPEPKKWPLMDVEPSLGTVQKAASVIRRLKQF